MTWPTKLMSTFLQLRRHRPAGTALPGAPRPPIGGSPIAGGFYSGSYSNGMITRGTPMTEASIWGFVWWYMGMSQVSYEITRCLGDNRPIFIWGFLTHDHIFLGGGMVWRLRKLRFWWHQMITWFWINSSDCRRIGQLVVEHVIFWTCSTL